jgi:hypothetical protein
MCAAALICIYTLTGSAVAQDAGGTKCIAATHSEFGAVKTLTAQCGAGGDCSYQAQPGNAGALSLLASMASRIETCWRTVGLVMRSEQKADSGIVRNYGSAGESCKLMISLAANSSVLADGYRASCKAGN